MSQLTFLFDGIADSKFKLYHEANPAIYEAFKKYTFRAINRNFKNFSAEFIFNVIRWESPTGSTGFDGYKINNNYKAFYSRMFMNEFEKYKGFFCTRKSKADEAFF